MASLSDYLAAKLLNHMFRVAAFSQPAGLFLALYTVAPTDAGGGTEVAGGGYTRTPLTFRTAAAKGDGVLCCTNQGDVMSGKSTANWGTATHIGVFDAVTGGNLLWWGPLDSPATLGLNTRFYAPDGSLSFSLD